MSGCNTAIAKQPGYDRVTMHVYSGTGNTLRVAEWMAETATARGIPAEVRQVVRGGPPADPAGAATLVGVLSPTHAFTAPWQAMKFVLGMPRGHGAHAFVVVTRGGFLVGRWHIPGLDGTCAYLLALLLWLKGYRVRGVRAIDMPVNWTSLHTGLPPTHVAALEDRARPRAAGFIEALLAGRRFFGGFVSLALGIGLLPISLMYLIMGRFFLVKLFFANNACNGCGECARRCPLGAIRMLGRERPLPYWTFDCASCMRCMAYCPRHAVEAGHSWAVLLYFAASIPAGWLAAAWLSEWSPWLRWLGLVPVKLAAVAVAYLLFWALLRIRAINALFTYTTLTHYYRRYHEPQTKLIHLAGVVCDRSAAGRHPAE